MLRISWKAILDNCVREACIYLGQKGALHDAQIKITQSFAINLCITTDLKQPDVPVFINKEVKSKKLKAVGKCEERQF